MNDDELRSLIRVAIQKHLSGSAPGSAPGPVEELRRDRPAPVSISFSQYRIERGAGDTECIIEPAVQCNHCGYCKCHGH